MSNQGRPKSLTEILSYLERGEEAIAILEEIFINPYSNTITLTDKQKYRIQEFFEFDDSE